MYFRVSSGSTRFCLSSPMASSSGTERMCDARVKTCTKVRRVCRVVGLYSSLWLLKMDTSRQTWGKAPNTHKIVQNLLEMTRSSNAQFWDWFGANRWRCVEHATGQLSTLSKRSMVLANCRQNLCGTCFCNWRNSRHKQFFEFQWFVTWPCSVWTN